MYETIVTNDEKRQIKSVIAQYVAKTGPVSRNDIAQACGYSMPTVFQKLKELIEAGVVSESGQMQSNGGRRAKLLSIVDDAKYALGINITRHHVELVLVGLNHTIRCMERRKLNFNTGHDYFHQLGKELQAFLDANLPRDDKLLGVGVGIPGILDREKKFIIKSHALQLENFSLKAFIPAIPYPVLFENDANCAAYSEELFRTSTAIYLSLNYTFGGAFSVDGKLYEGDNNKSSEIGHMILVPNGRRCYCGKKGCVDSYCAARQLDDGDLQEFFSDLRAGKEETVERWKQYLNYLAIVIQNLRVVYDCDIIVGGYVGGFLRDDLQRLERMTMEYNNFDLDASFLHCGKYKWEASAYGVALRILDNYLSSLA